MEIDQNEQYLATGDINVNLKIWNISEYCKNIHLSSERSSLKNKIRKFF